MKNTNWREIVEIVGIVSIVGSLLILAMEVHQSSRIASAEMRLDLREGFQQIHHERSSNPEFARLFAKLSDPASHLITATEREQSRGLTMQYVNVYLGAQFAHDEGLIDDVELARFRDSLARVLEHHPGLHEHFNFVYETMPMVSGMSVFEPIAELANERKHERKPEIP